MWSAVSVSDGALQLASDANEILDAADAAFAGFVAAARDFVASNFESELEDEEPIDPAAQSNVAERASLNLARENVAAIVWATGYDYDYGWLRAPVIDASGRPLQRRGVTPVAGLYFLGLHWMHTFKSGLFSGVGSDAEYLVERITAMKDSH